MRRRLTLVLSAVTLTACGSKGPISYMALTPQPTTTAYSCALRKINELGYTVTNTNRDAGFIAGEKQTTSDVRRALTGNQYTSTLTVSIFEGDATKGRTLRVTAGQARARSNIFTTSTSTESPSDVGISDANAILSACSEGPITKQARATFTAAAREYGNE